MHINEHIKIIDDAICQNLALISEENRGFISQNILAQLRNFVEFTYIKIMSPDGDIQISRNTIPEAEKYVKGYGRYKWLCNFHDCLQPSSSHYTRSKDVSERLMLKYYEYLIRMRDFYRENYKIEVLSNINNSPLCKHLTDPIEVYISDQL